LRAAAERDTRCVETNDSQPSNDLPLDLQAILADDRAGTLAAIVQEIHSHGDDADFVSMMGVGPLESLFHQGHGEALWPEVERLARTDPLFRRALRSVWAYDSPEFDRREALLAELPED
jgi:hypothetical protein